MESAFDECEVLQVMADQMKSEKWNREALRLLGEEYQVNEGYVEKILNCFIHHGPFGNHFCIVIEPLGPSLSSLIDGNASAAKEVGLKPILDTPVLKLLGRSFHTQEDSIPDVDEPVLHA